MGWFASVLIVFSSIIDFQVKAAEVEHDAAKTASGAWESTKEAAVSVADKTKEAAVSRLRYGIVGSTVVFA